MRIAHLITRLIIGGAQENTLHNVEDLHQRHRDQVLLMTGPDAGPEGSLLERAQQGGFEVAVLADLRRNIHPVRDLQAYRQISRQLRDWKPDLLHTHSSKAGILGRMAAHQLGIPVVHSIHGASFHYGQSAATYRGYVWLEKRAARWTDRFICVADAMRNEYVAAGIAKADRFHTVYSGFETEPFLNADSSRIAIRERLGLSADDLVVGKIGRLFPLKGHEFVIAAAERVVAEEPRAKFLFVGDGILRDRYREEIERRGLSQHFLFAGLVPPDQVPEWLSAMDIVVHTSQWEGLARVLPQALLAGKPVISYDVGGAKEVVVPDVTGFLLQRDATVELAEAILTLACDEGLRHRMGQAGREHCADRFCHREMTRQIREIYLEVLQARGKVSTEKAAAEVVPHAE